MDLEKIVAELEQERDRLNQAIDLLKECNFPASAAEDRCQGRQRLRSATGPRTHGGRQKAIVGAHEETLGREKT